MSCIIKSKKNQGVESLLGKQLIDIYKDVDKASDVYSKLSHPSFIEKFGDWINEDLGNRTNDLGEPLLIERIGRNNAKNYYFLDKYENKLDLITNEFSSFPTANLTNVITEITEQLSNYIFSKYIQDNFNDFSNINKINLQKEIKDFVDLNISIYEDSKKYTDDAEDIDSLNYVIEQLNNIKLHSDEFEVEVRNYFKSKNLQINDEKVESDTQQALEEGLTGGDIKQSFENNSKDKATANVKLLLSFLPRYTYNIEEGEFEKTYGGILGEETFMNMHGIHQELLKLFSDLSPKETINGVEDLYNLMTDKLNKLSEAKPYYKDLLNLLDSVNENKRTEFVIAFSHRFNNFLVSSWDKKNNTFKIINASSQNDITSQILNNWSKSFHTKFITDVEIKQTIPVIENGVLITKEVTQKSKGYNTKLITKLKNDIQKLADEFYKSSKNLDYENISVEDFAEKFSKTSMILENIFFSIGINMNTNAFRYYILQLNKTSNTNSKLEYINTISNIINNLRVATKSLETFKNKPFKFNLISDYKNSLFKELAEAESFYNEELTDTNVLANNKMYWAFSNPSYISNIVNKIKSNKEVLNQLRLLTINKNSQWIEYLLAEDIDQEGNFVFDENQREIESKKRIKKLQLNLFTSFQEDSLASDGVSNKDISETDQIIDEINKIEKAGVKNTQGKLIGSNAIYSTSTPADKPTRFEISIGKYIDEITIKSSNQGLINSEFSNEILEIFTNYFLDEYNRMKEASKEIDRLDPKDLKVHYHTVKNQIFSDNGVVLGNAFKSQLFPELSFENISEDLNSRLNLYDLSTGLPINNDIFEFTNEQKEIIKNEISKIFNNLVRENVESLIQKQIIKPLPNGNYKVIGIDKKVLNEYNATNVNELTQASVTDLIASYTLNGAISKVEYTKLFTGDPAMYKNMVDFFKRVPATYTDGLPLRTGLIENDKYFNISVIENQVITSNYLEDIKNSLKKVGKTDDEIKNIIKLYNGDVNSTDAQAWITPNRWKFIMERTGKWNNARERVYKKMIGEDNTPLNYEDFKYAAQPLKGVYFGVVNGTPTYLKYSQAVLFPQLIKGSQLNNLYKSMLKSNVDEAITLDGIKVGANLPNSITDENNNIITSNLSTITLNNSEWKLQQDLPTKLIKPTLIGSQIQKNIFSSINPDKPYFLPNGNVITGMEMIDKINDSLSKLSNSAIEQLSNDLGLDENGRIDEDKFYAILEDEVLNSNYSINTIKAVQKGMPLESLPSLKNKINNIFFSKVKSAAVKIKTPGGSFIQMSNFGLDKISADDIGVKWLVKPDELKPPIIEEVEIDWIDKETGEKSKRKVNKIKPGQILINHSLISKFIPNYQKLSLEELNNKIDSNLLRAIGYRIPNQGMSSNDPLQIVGILPPTVGDTVVAYSEIPTKTGSDFDIDKMYIMIPNSEYKEGKLIQSEISTNKKGLQNELFELYWSVLTNENTYEDLITPIDFDYLKNHIKYLHGDNSKQLGFNLKFYNPLYQIKLKHIYSGGKSGVGITATQLVDHNRSKHVVNLGFNNYYLGVGYNLNNETVFDTFEGDSLSEKLNTTNPKFKNTQFKISHTISAFLNAFVDNAKDPYVNDGNYNTYTSGVAFMLIRAGVHPYWINSFIGQPILTELAQFVKDYESKSSEKEEAWKTAKQIFKENYAKKILGSTATDKQILSYLKKFKEGIVYNYDELTDNIFNKDNPNDLNSFYKKQLNVLALFEKYVNQAKKLNNSVELSRFDTEGAGKDFLDMNIFINKIKELLEVENKDGELKNHINKYIRNGKLTSLGTQVLNTLEYADKIIDNNPNIFLLSSKPVIDIMNNISLNSIKSTGGSLGLLKDKKLASLISRNIYTYMFSKFKPLQIEGSKLKFLKNTINDIIEYKNNQPEDIDERNIFIDSLVFYDNSFGINFGNMPVDVKNVLYRSFRDLYFTNPELALKIIKSQFIMNGFNSSLIDFIEFIPHEFFIKNNFRNFIRTESYKLQNGEYSNDFISKFIRHNIDNNILVPKVSNKRIKPKNININNNIITLNFSMDAKDELNAKNYGLGFNNEGDTIYPRYLKNQMGYLYELEGYINKSPQYVISSTFGFNEKKSHLKIKEYDVNTSEFKLDALNNKINKLSKNEKIKLSKTEGFIPRDQFNIRDIPNIYIKNLSEILLPEENTVSLQEDINDNEESPLDCN